MVGMLVGITLILHVSLVVRLWWRLRHVPGSPFGWITPKIRSMQLNSCNFQLLELKMQYGGLVGSLRTTLILTLIMSGNTFRVAANHVLTTDTNAFETLPQSCPGCQGRRRTQSIGERASHRPLVIDIERIKAYVEHQCACTTDALKQHQSASQIGQRYCNMIVVAKQFVSGTVSSISCLRETETVRTHADKTVGTGSLGLMTSWLKSWLAPESQASMRRRTAREFSVPNGECDLEQHRIYNARTVVSEKDWSESCIQQSLAQL